MKNILIKDNFLTDIDKDEIEKLLTSNYFQWFITEERNRTSFLLEDISNLNKSGFKNTILIKESHNFVICFMTM